MSDSSSPFTQPRTPSLLDGLNPQQVEAVQHQGSPLLIVAGAGSGKTTVLTRRIAYLMANRGVRPWEILAITFTNKAAAEMKERVEALIGPAARHMWVSTFHSMCVRLLRAHHDLVDGLNSNFTIYDADDSRNLLSQIIKAKQLDPKQFTARGLANQISSWKNELIGPDVAATQPGQPTRIAADVYADYQARLRAANAVDFDDLIGEVVRILRTYPDVAAHYRARFRHVLVDEYQDTNHAQYVLIHELVGQGESASELCVVGDGDQSIYAFRGATVRNIEEFERDYPAAHTILLEQNYRSTQTILSAANAVIAQNDHRRPKNLWTDSGDGHPIIGYVADNEHDEARFVASQIDDLVDHAGYSYRDIAVMYRTNASSRALEEIFIRNGLPYTVVGGTRFYERAEIKDIMAYLKVLHNPDDDVALRRIINTPRRGIGQSTIDKVEAYAATQRVSLWAALGDTVAGHAFPLAARSMKALAGFVVLIQQLQEVAANTRLDVDEDVTDVGAVVNEIIERSGYAEQLKKSNDPQDQARRENLDELISVAREFSEDAVTALAFAEEDELLQVEQPGQAPVGSVAAFLERVSLVADSDQIPDEAGPDAGSGVITLMTLHTAKGLEYPVVFLTGWEEGQFPHARSMADAEQLSEERRLAYVGITRARQRLFISRAIMRSAWGGAPQPNPASRFVAEIPQELISWERTEEDSLADSGFGFGGYGSYGRSRTVRSEYTGDEWGRDDWASAPSASSGASTAPWRSGARPSKPKVSTGPTVQYAVGDRVVHDKYGMGTVAEVTTVAQYVSVVVDFGDSTTVRLLVTPSLPMQKL